MELSIRAIFLREATITKEPLTETKSVDVLVTHEEMITTTRRPAGETVSTSGQKPVESRTEVKVPLRSEVQVTKQPYVKVCLNSYCHGSTLKK
jgi:uncharacterized protein (TIGR02271 family)